MGNQLPSFETNDNLGTTETIETTVGTSWTAFPTISGNRIQSYLVVNDPANPTSKELQVSFDAGATKAAVLFSGDSMSGDLRNKTQIWLKASASSTQFMLTLSLEDFI